LKKPSKKISGGRVGVGGAPTVFSSGSLAGWALGLVGESWEKGGGGLDSIGSTIPAGQPPSWSETSTKIQKGNIFKKPIDESKSKDSMASTKVLKKPYGLVPPTCGTANSFPNLDGNRRFFDRNPVA